MSIWALWVVVVFLVGVSGKNISHRYSFSGNSFDSVGGREWNANILTGAFISNVDAVFDPNIVHHDYGMQISPGLLTPGTSSTIEIWYMPHENSGSCKLLCFEWFSLGRDNVTGNVALTYDEFLNSDKILHHNLITTVAFQRPRKAFIAVVFSLGAYVKLYFDGELADISPWRFSGFGNQSTNENFIGTCGGSNLNSEYDGAIDEIRIWDSALTDEEIRCHELGGVDDLGWKCMASQNEDNSKPTISLSHNRSCPNPFPRWVPAWIPFWVLLMGSFLLGACISAIAVILFCKCAYGRSSKRVKYGHRYEALDREDGLGDDGIPMQVII